MISVPSNTAKLIYETGDVAAIMAGTLAKQGGVEYVVHKVTTGFQVCPVKVVHSAMPPAKPLPVKKPDLVVTVTEGKSWVGEPFVVVTLPLKYSSPKYFGVDLPGQQPSDKPNQPGKFIGKASVIGYEIKGDQVILKLPAKYAKKIGL